jgi:hypothetical protein
MDTILSFFSHLILFTAGLVVIVFWLALFAIVAIEAHDFIFGEPSSPSEDDVENLEDYR